MFLFSITMFNNIFIYFFAESQKVLNEIKLLLKKISTDCKEYQEVSSLMNNSNFVKEPDLDFVENSVYRSASKAISLA